MEWQTWRCWGRELITPGYLIDLTTHPERPCSTEVPLSVTTQQNSQDSAF